jgi:WD40 repeat protein
MSVCFIPEKIFSCSQGSELFMWDIKTRRIIREFHKFEESDDGLLRVCSNGSVVVSNSRLGQISVYDIETGNPLNIVETHLAGGFAGCRLLESNIWFAEAFSGKLFSLQMNSAEYSPMAEFKDHGMIMDISVKNNFIGIALEDSTVCVLDSRNCSEPLWTNNMKLGDPILTLSLVDENRAVVGSAQKSIFEVTRAGKSVFYEMPNPGIDHVEIRRDGRIWATGGWDGRVRLFDAKKRTPLAVLQHHRGGVHSVEFAEDGLLASAGEDRGIALWSLYRK